MRFHEMICMTHDQHFKTIPHEEFVRLDELDICCPIAVATSEERERCAKVAKDKCNCASLGPYEGKVKCGPCHIAIEIMKDPLKGGM